MNYHLTIDGESPSMANLLEYFKELGKSAFQQENNNHDFLIHQTISGNNRLLLSITSFCDISKSLIKSIIKISKKFSDLDFKLRFIDTIKEKVGGFQIKNNEITSSFMYDDKKVMCEIIEDYICSLHISNEKKSSISTDGAILSEFLFSEKVKIGNLNYLQENRIIHFANEEKLIFKIEYNDENKNNDKVYLGYKTFGLSDFSWSKLNDNEEGLLHELIKGNVSENFFHIVGFRFASEIACENGMKGLDLAM